MGFVKSVLGLFESTEETIKSVKKDKNEIRMFAGAALFFSAVYGFIYGFMSGDAATAAWNLLKFPATIFLSALFPYLTLYILVKVFGIKMDMKDLAASLSITFAVSMIVAVAIIPLNILYTYTNHPPGVIHSLTLFISIIAGLFYLARTYKILGEAGEGTALIATIISAIIILFVMVQFVDIFFDITGTPVRSGFIVEDVMRDAASKTSLVR